MVDVPDDILDKITKTPLPRAPLVDPKTGMPTPTWQQHWTQYNYQVGEVVSGINRNRQVLVDLQTEFTDELGNVSDAYIAADAVVAADAASARATLSTTLTAEIVLGTNLCPFSTFDQGNNQTGVEGSPPSPNITGWTTVAANGAPSSNWAWGVTPIGETGNAFYRDKHVPGERTLFVFNPTFSSGADIDIIGTAQPAEGGKYYGASVLVSAPSAIKPTAFLVCVNSSGSAIDFKQMAGTVGTAGSPNKLSDYGELKWIGRLPSATTSIKILMRNNSNNGINFWTRPQTFKARQGQTESPPWTPDQATLRAETNVLSRAFVNATTGEAIAQIVQEASAGGGDPTRIGLRNGSDGSSDIALVAKQIFFGSSTVFEDAFNTIYTESGGRRYRDRGPFGASGDLLEWFGPTSVALNSETKTNGYFATATDGKVYIGSDPANAMTAVTLSEYFVIGFTSAGVGYSGVVTATAVGGDGGYTYQWVRTAQAGANRVNCSNTGIRNPTFSTAPGANSSDTWTCTVRETSTGRAFQASVSFTISII